VTAATLNPTQLKYVHEIEAATIRRIEAMLEPIMGRGNYRVQTAADIDFSQYRTDRGNLQAQPDAAGRDTQPADERIDQQPAGRRRRARRTGQSAASAGHGTGHRPGSARNTGCCRSGRADQHAQGFHHQLRTGQDRSARTSVRPVRSAGCRWPCWSRRRWKPTRPAKPTVPPSEVEMQADQCLTREAMGFNEARGDTLNVSAPFTEVRRGTGRNTDLERSGNDRPGGRAGEVPAGRRRRCLPAVRRAASRWCATSRRRPNRTRTPRCAT
jgi:flagellar M-ring protein FliF